MGGRSLRALIDENREEIVKVARAHGAYDVRLVGSVARGDDNSQSDVDLLVRFEPGRSVFDQAGLVHDLTQLLGVEVDVISEGGLRDEDPIAVDATPL